MGHTTDGTHEPSDEHYTIANDDTIPPGATVDRSDDGTITSVVTADGEWSVHVDEDTEFGQKLDWIAAHEGMSASEALREAIEEHAEPDL